MLAMAAQVEQLAFVGSRDVDAADLHRARGRLDEARQAANVDFPLPDRPMTTNTSPSATSRSTSRTATTLPVLVCSAVPARPMANR